MEPAKAQIDYPSYNDLKIWWREQQEFFETPLGRAFGQVFYIAMQTQKQKDQYESLILDYEMLKPHANPSPTPKQHLR